MLSNAGELFLEVMKAGNEMRAIADIERQILGAPELAEVILSDLPLVEVPPERIIRCSPENLDKALARALAKCREFGELWKVEIVE
jgi:hypothetical protein